MKDFEKFDKDLIDKWRQEAGKVPESTRQEIMTMKKAGKSGRQISADLELPSEHVSIILIEEFAKERGETPDFTVGRPGETLKDWIPLNSDPA